MHEGLLATISTALGAALVLGLAARRLGLSPIVGFLLGGILLGPHTPGFVADAAVAGQLAEMGVVLLMFGVGLHFHLKDLLAVRGIAVPGAIATSTVATTFGALVALGAGWNVGQAIVLGLGLSVASTVVLTRALDENGRLESPEGHVAVGWLIVEDVFTVLVLILLPVLAGSLRGDGGGFGEIARGLGLALLKLIGLCVLMLVVGSRAIPWLLFRVARMRSRELFTLTVLVLALAVAVASARVFGVSMALGAFLAGMVVGSSQVSHQAAADALPMRDAFAVLFFVSVGMLFDPGILFDHPGLVAGTLAILFVGKPLAALSMVLVLGYSVRTALTVALGLAQIGEFTFILADVAVGLDLLPDAGRSALVASALLSISVHPILFRSIGRIEDRLKRHRRLWELLTRRHEARGRVLNQREAERQAASDPVDAIVVGYGPVGRTVTRILRDFGLVTVVVDLNVDTVARLCAEGRPAIFGDAAREEVLRAAGIQVARSIVVTLPDLPSRIPVVIAAGQLNPDIEILVRARYVGERPHLEDVGATAVCYEEAEAAVGLARLVLARAGADESQIEAEAVRIRGELEIHSPLGG